MSGKKKRTRMKRLRFGLTILALAVTAFAAGRAKAQQQLPKFDFDAVHYDVRATLQPSTQTMTADAKIELVANAASRTILLELHPDLQVKAVTLSSDGRKLDFQRDSMNPLDLRVSLPSDAQNGMHVTIRSEEHTSEL